VTGAEWLLRALGEQGVDRIFGNPGSTELPLIEALGRQEAVRYVLALHESVAVGMADGFAQQSGGLAAVNVHVQPGMANALSGVLNAARARVPLLVTVGQQVSALLPSAPFLGGDVVGMARPLAKAALEVETPAALPEAVARSIGLALSPPRGPVVLSLPLDVQAGEIGDWTAHDPAPARAPAPRPAELQEAAALLAAARAPVLLAGDGVADAGAGAALARLADRLGAPIFGEPFAAKVPLSTDHPLWRGPLPGFAAEIGAALAGHDVVVALGMPVFRLFGDSPGEALGAGQHLVHADVDPAEIGRSHRPAVGLVADPGAVLAGLLARVGAADPARRAREAALTLEGRRLARRRIAAAASAERVGPAALAGAIAGAVSRRDLVVDEALTAGRDLRAALGRRDPGAWLAHRGSALGWGLPAAVGAKLADPARRVVAVQGDGGALFGLSALWTAAHEGVGIALVIADNRGYEILRAGMEGMTGHPTGPWPGLALRDPPLDLESLCRGYGASVARTGRVVDLAAALRELWTRSAAGPAVLIVDVEGRTAPVGYPVAPAPG
jgi:benzoylformate decarboxylase